MCRLLLPCWWIELVFFYWKIQMDVYHLGWTLYGHQTKGKVAMGSGSCLNDSWWWQLGCTVGFMREIAKSFVLETILS